ncbi:MAG TPA: YihY/virulence factor BrkB family protein [Clostridia bacterium]|nr:YihY/virulence factor BrkB family protein [Clostridia bacterium]
MAAESAWKLGGLSVVELGKRVFREVTEDEVANRAAGLAYYFVLALFPAMFFIISMTGLLASRGQEMQQALFQYMQTAVPGSAAQLVSQTLHEVMNASGGGKLSFGLLAAIWSASAGVVALIDALNVAYNVKDSRSFLKKRGTAIALTLALAVLVLSALTLVLFGGQIAEWVGQRMNMGAAFTIAWKIVQWPVAIGFMLVSFSLVYYFAPNVEQRKWFWVTPGAAAGLTLWALATVAVKVYLGFSDTYSKTYGSLGGAIVLLLWLYLTGAAVMIGAEVNSEIENAAAERLGDTEAKARGEKAPGDMSDADADAQVERGGRPPREKRPAA